MSFDWVGFLSAHRIEFRDRGENVAKGNVVVRCPWCGEADQGGHMGINLQGRGWGCWRNAAHRGRRPERLIAALIGCSWMQAAKIAGAGKGPALGAPNALAQVLAQLEGAESEDADETQLRFPKNFRHVHDAGLGRHFVDYLRTRGYPGWEAQEMAEAYNLRYATDGAFRYRIVVPVYMPQLGLTNWTGRAIDGEMSPRYRTLTTDKEKAEKARMPQARLSIERCLWNARSLFEQTRPGETIVVCEGPFDAMRVDWLGFDDRSADKTIHGTCLFGKNLSVEQEILLADLSDRFRNLIVLIDSDAVFDSLSFHDRLSRYGYTVAKLPAGLKDPAELKRRGDLRALVRETIEG